MANIRKPVNVVTENKVRKNPFERRARMGFVADPKYHTQWFNDTGTTIQDMQEAGFQFVKENERYGYKNEGNPDSGTSIESRVALNVGRADGQENVTAYLMRIPISEWNELIDPLKREAQSTQQEIKRSIQTMKQDGFYGDVA